MEVDCGTNHTIARDSDGRVYSWGFGGYGRLGHAKQEDLWSPMPIDQFTGTNALTRATKIAAGSTFSMALDGKFLIVTLCHRKHPLCLTCFCFKISAFFLTLYSF